MPGLARVRTVDVCDVSIKRQIGSYSEYDSTVRGGVNMLFVAPEFPLGIEIGCNVKIWQRSCGGRVVARLRREILNLSGVLTESTNSKVIPKCA